MQESPIHPDLLAVARGDKAADLLLTNGKVINVVTGEIDLATVAIWKDRIAGVGDYRNAGQVIDVSGSYIAPGFIDAHMHVESTMMPPSEFVRVTAPHGTTGAVLDPHEIANVLGIPGIRWIMDEAREVPMNLMFAVSSCVPASPLETSGARLEAADLAPLFEDDRVVALAEMMNFPSTIQGAPDILAKINLGLRKSVVDGHAPGLSGKHLQAYIAAGISSDHECTTIEEAHEKLRLGMRIFIREGSAARNLESLLPLVNNANKHRFCFCTDDRHPADLINEGHIDHVIRKAIRLGLNPVTAIAMASLHTAEHYRRRDLGAVVPGFQADLIIFDDLNDLQARQVYCGGKLVAENGKYLAPRSRHAIKPPGGNTVHLPAKLSEECFRIAASGPKTSIRVIGMQPHQLVTTEMVLPSKIVDGFHVADPARDVLKLVVIERHHGSGNVGRGFIHGFGLKRGALASTVGHDSHNLAIVGVNDRDMLVAARALADSGGGQCVTSDGKVLALLLLPIAGLMSDQPAERIVEQQKNLHNASRLIGCPLDDPFMPLSFMPLAVIPKLKLTDMGLVNVEQFKIVPLEMASDER